MNEFWFRESEPRIGRLVAFCFSGWVQIFQHSLQEQTVLFCERVDSCPEKTQTCSRCSGLFCIERLYLLSRMLSWPSVTPHFCNRSCSTRHLLEVVETSASPSRNCYVYPSSNQVHNGPIWFLIFMVFFTCLPQSALNGDRLLYRRLQTVYWRITVPQTFCSDPLEGGGTIYSYGFFFVP